MVCTFFGHRKLNINLEPTLRSALVDLIENKGVDTFYVGTHGEFDYLVRKTLKALAKEYSHISFTVVLAYLSQDVYGIDSSNTIYPEGIEKVPLRCAIVWRNNWMIDKSDYVVTYVRHNFGGAAQFKERAEKKGKQL